MQLFRRLLGRQRASADPQWQTPFVQEIGIAMLRLVPEAWESAFLMLEVTDNGFGTGLSHSAITRRCPEDFALRDSDFLTPDMAVIAATRKLELGWVERKGSFKKAIISAVRDGEEWEVRSEYEHEA